jgi:putative membrane protein
MSRTQRDKVLSAFRVFTGVVVALKLGVLGRFAMMALDPARRPVDPELFVPALSVFIFYSLVHMLVRLGWRRALIFMLLAYGICTTAETLGVLTGAVFGRYEYSPELHPRAFGLVPWGTISYWRFALYGAYAFSHLAQVRRGGRSRRLGVWGFAALGALLMVALDLVIDPVEVARGTWTWFDPGPYFGIPLQNFLGWFLTSVVVLLAFRAVELRRPSRSLLAESRWLPHLPVWDVLSESLSYIIAALGYGLTGPAVIGFLAMLPFWIAAVRSLLALRET